MDNDTSLVKILQIIKRRGKSFLVAFSVMLIVSLGLIFFLNDKFSGASARLLIGTETEEPTEEYNQITGEPIYEEVIKYGGSSISEESIVFYKDILQNSDLLENLISTLNLDYSVEELKNAISVKVPENSSTMIVEVGSKEIDAPQKIIKKLIPLFEEKVFDITEVDKIKVMNISDDYQVSSSEGFSRIIIASIIISLFIAGTSVLIIEYLDDSVQSMRDIEEKLKISVLGQLQNEDTIEEDFKKIRTKFEYSNKLQNKKIITIAGLDKSYSNVSITLSKVLAEIKREVLLVDADLRSPIIHKTLNLSNDSGLSNVLETRENLVNSIQLYREDKYKVLTAGSKLENPSEQLSSYDLRELANYLKDSFDYVFINGHSLGEFTDTIALSTTTDGIILLVKENKTKITEINKIKKLLEDIDVDILGVIYSKI